MASSTASAPLLSSNPALLSPKLSSPSLPNSFLGLRKPSLSARPPSLSSNRPSHSRRSFVVKASRQLPRVGSKAPDFKRRLSLANSSSSPQLRPKLKPLSASLPAPPPLDLTEDNVRQVLTDARAELGQIFDTSVGITGKVELAELDGPFVKISLNGRFWHKRSDVLARVGNYLKQRIPEILEVDIEDEKQLDDSPENF